MFTLGICYLIIYSLLILSLFSISFIKFPIYCLTEWSVSTFLIFINRYTKVKELFLFFIFSLTGLPPVGLFFVKFNILTFIFYQTHIIIIIILFIMFFLNMLYYAQLFNIKNFKKNIYHVFNNNVFVIFKKNRMSVVIFENYSTYNIIFFLVMVCFISILTIFFFNDFYLIASL